MLLLQLLKFYDGKQGIGQKDRQLHAIICRRCQKRAAWNTSLIVNNYASI